MTESTYLNSEKIYAEYRDELDDYVTVTNYSYIISVCFIATFLFLSVVLAGLMQGYMSLYI